MRQETSDKIVKMLDYFSRVPYGASEVSQGVLMDLLPRRGDMDQSTLKQRAEEWAKKNGLTVNEVGSYWRFQK